MAVLQGFPDEQGEVLRFFGRGGEVPLSRTGKHAERGEGMFHTLFQTAERPVFGSFIFPHGFQARNVIHRPVPPDVRAEVAVPEIRPLAAGGDAGEHPSRAGSRHVVGVARRGGMAESDQGRTAQFSVAGIGGQSLQDGVQAFPGPVREVEGQVEPGADPQLGHAQFRHSLPESIVFQDGDLFHVVLGYDERFYFLACGRNPKIGLGMGVFRVGRGVRNLGRPLPDGCLCRQRQCHHPEEGGDQHPFHHRTVRFL